MNTYQIFSENIERRGRHVNHDSQSWLYAFDGSGMTYQSVKHPRYIPVLDQGNLGSCTGNAITGCLGSGNFFATLPAGTLDAENAVFDETVAVGLYSDATQIDGYRGQYPPNDTGSDGLSVAKAAQKRGLIAGYQHTFTFNDALKALTLQPVIIGINWYDSMFTPNSDGIVSIAKGSPLDGGHEIVVDELDATRQLIGCTNSWSTSWGLGGRFYISFGDFERLLGENGDCTVPVALNKPAPVPTPPAPPAPGPVNPTPAPEDVALWADVQKWSHLKGLS